MCSWSTGVFFAMDAALDAIFGLHTLHIDKLFIGLKSIPGCSWTNERWAVGEMPTSCHHTGSIFNPSFILQLWQ